jgi:hypothetical protein
MRDQSRTLWLLALAIALWSGPSTAQPAAPLGKQRPTATKAQLSRAQRVTIQYLPPVSNPRKKTRIILTKAADIRRLVRQLDFRPVRPCRCKHKYELTFTLAGGRAVKVRAFSHGWRFMRGTVRQRRDRGGLMRHLDRLFGIKPGDYYL